MTDETGLEEQEEEQETGKRDLIDEMLDDLNDGVDGISFDRDVLDTDIPEDWGALELSGESTEMWADGKLIDQELFIDLWVCVSDRGSQVKRKVQRVLKAWEGKANIGWMLKQRAYLYDLNKVLWHWTISVCGPLGPEDDEDPEDEEPDDTEPDDTEPEDTEPDDTEPEDTEPEDEDPEDEDPEDTEPEEEG